MNLRLRRRHRHITVVVAIAAPLVFAASLLTRSESPVDRIPGAASNMIAPDAIELSQGGFTLDETPLTATLFAKSTAPTAPRAVQLTPSPGYAVTGADVLVYWHNGDTVADRIPDEAVLLGSLAGSQARVFDLPPVATGGQLLFYSLAQQRLYDERWRLMP